MQPTEIVIRSVLERAGTYRWTTMGFGMIRTYLDDAKRWRLTVWDDRLQVPGVSTIHDHPWSFTSHVICGTLINQRYRCEFAEGVASHQFHRIKTGEGGGPVEHAVDCLLRPRLCNTWQAGQSYRQELREVHETLYDRGTVTLNDRTPPTKEHTARVFWPKGQQWVDAMPRSATHKEIVQATQAALELLA